MIKFKMKIDCGNEERARIINDSLKIDNEDYIKSEVDGKYVLAYGRAEEVLSALHTINDFLSCLQLALELSEI